MSGELFSIDGNKRYFVQTSEELKDARKAAIKVGTKLLEQSKGDYKK